MKGKHDHGELPALKSSGHYKDVLASLQQVKLKLLEATSLRGLLPNQNSGNWNKTAHGEEGEEIIDDEEIGEEEAENKPGDHTVVANGKKVRCEL